MLAKQVQQVKWDVRYSVSYGRELVTAMGVDGNFAVAYINGDGRWQVEFWNGGFAGLLGYRSLVDAAKDAQRWAMGDEAFHPAFFECPAWLDAEDGQPDDGVYQLNLMDEIDEWWKGIEAEVRVEEALERAAALRQAA
jgi:hypothetical protein